MSDEKPQKMSVPGEVPPIEADELKEVISTLTKAMRVAKKGKKESKEIVARKIDELLDDDKLPEMYYTGSKGKYWMKEKGRFIELNETGISRQLRSFGFSILLDKKTGMSEIDLLLAFHQKEKNFEWIGTIAGWPVGCFDYDGIRLLNLRESREWELPDNPKPTPKLDSFFLNLLGKDQINYEKAWVKLSRQTLAKGRARILEGRQPKFRIGQAFTLVGTKGDGKTVAGSVLTAMLAGPCATAGNPAQSARGETSFNEDLAEKMVHVLDDETGDADYKARQKFGESIKRSVATQEKRVHGKGVKAITLEPFVRSIILLNDEPENVQILPPLDGSIGDKLLICKTVGKGFGKLEDDAEGYEERMDELIEEIPDYLAALEKWEIPPEIMDARYGVKSFHHPVVVEMVGELGGEDALRNVLIACDEKHLDYKGEPMTTSGLFTKLMGEMETARRLSSVTRHIVPFGKLMTKLRNRYPAFMKRERAVYGAVEYVFDFKALKSGRSPS